MENGVNTASCGEDFALLAPLGGCVKPCLSDLTCGHPCNRTCHIQPHDTILCHVLVDKVRPLCNHTNTMQCHQDPDKVPCQSSCDVPMNCEHECKSKCHITKEDKDHANKYFCMQPCTKIHDICGHTCQRRCGQSCGGCTEKIEFTFNCGHINKTAECSKTTYLKCEVKIDKTLQCGHVTQVTCAAEISKIMCNEKCTKLLKCGHKCQLRCSENCDRITQKCREKCIKILECGHQCLLECYKVCGPCQTMITKPLLSCDHMIKQNCGDSTVKACLEQCTRTLECGHSCKLLCCEGEKCKPCSSLVEKIIPECGHSVNVPCSSDVPQRESCTQLCELTLECGHQCKQMCAESCVCNEETTVTTTDVCGHQVTLLCKEINSGKNNSYSYNKIIFLKRKLLFKIISAFM